MATPGPTVAAAAAAPAAAGAAPAAAGAAPGAPAADNLNASLYVGDLGQDVTEVMLLEVFNEVGPVASIRVCRDAVTRRSLGYAYVNFHNYADAEKALDTKNYTPVKGVPIRIMWSARDPAARKNNDGNIFIKNLDKRIDNQAIFNTFSEYGRILSCKVATDQAGESKGFGFIHFEKEDDAQLAIEKVNGKSIMDRLVYVGKFVPKSGRSDSAKGKRYTNVFVKNLDVECSEDQLKDACAKFGEITSIIVMKNQEGKSKGFGFVNYATPEEAAKVRRPQAAASSPPAAAPTLSAPCLLACPQGPLLSALCRCFAYEETRLIAPRRVQ